MLKPREISDPNDKKLEGGMESLMMMEEPEAKKAKKIANSEHEDDDKVFEYDVFQFHWC